MIARVWRGHTKKEDAETYWRFLTENAEQDCRKTAGNHGVSVLKRLEGDFAHFMFISLWDSMEGIHNYAGPDFDRAHYFPEDLKYVINPPSHVEHFEVFMV